MAGKLTKTALDRLLADGDAETSLAVARALGDTEIRAEVAVDPSLGV